MPKRLVSLLTFLCVFFPSIAFSAQLNTSVVKVFVASNKMDYYRPWQSQGISVTSGSGAIIAGDRILTNAHVISDHTFIQVKKHGDPKKYTAKVVATGHDCDLALLRVEDKDFFKGTQALEFGDLPDLQETVTVLGYPQGGEKLSITEGVVSRIEMSSYAQTSRKLLAVQIDAAINPGNSGGPVVQGNKIVGIAMQVFQAGQNIGYMIPVPIIDHFFEDLQDEQYDGIPLLGINYTNTENDVLKEYYQIPQEREGVLITQIMPFSPAVGYLQKDDIILEIDGVKIGQDGTFPFRGSERLDMPYLITKKQINSTVHFKIIRQGKEQKIEVTLKSFIPLVPLSHAFEKPPYYIYGGIVFTVLSTDLLKAWGQRWWEKAPIELSNYLMGDGRFNDINKREIVVLLNVLADDINVGYQDLRNSVVSTVNGEEFTSFEEFVKLMDKIKANEKYLTLATQNYSVLIINNENIDAINESILKRYNIPAQYSADVGEWLSQN